MRKTFIYLTSLIFLSTGCDNPQPTNTAGIDPVNMDTKAIPGDDFYRYTNGGWIDKHPLKPEHSRYGSFDQLGDLSQEQVKNLIVEVSKTTNTEGSIAQKIGDLYAMVLDSAQLNSQSNTPLKNYISHINTLQHRPQLSLLLAKMFRDGYNPFFGLYVYADDKNSSMNILHLVQGGIQMGDRDYYIGKDAKTEAIRAQYLKLIERLFLLTDYTEAEAKAAANTVLQIETQLAQVSYPREKLRNPEANYHKIPLAELKKQVGSIDWFLFFEGIGIKDIKDLNLAQPEPLIEVGKIINQLSIEEITTYLTWNVINGSCNYLSDAYLETAFDFYGKTLSGKQELRPRWKRAVDVVNNVLGEAVGEMYVAKHFPPANKERMLSLVNNLQSALGERITDLAWMSPDTKVKAMEKLASFHVKIGYPDKWRDYSALKIDKKLSYFENIQASNNFDFEYMIAKFNQPLDTDEWHMTPQTVNAYYNPATNEICFPAAILQPPFFNMEADDAVNYGAIGVVIGHEMTHGFDDQGRQYDKNGNLADWWTAEDATQFDVRAKVLVDFFNQIVVIDTVHANGAYTLGENIADHGGLQVSWHAYKNSLKNKPEPQSILGFTPGQRFFLAYATVWGGNIRPEEILRLTKMDSHSLGKWRVNGALPHIDAWYEAFDIKENNKLFLPKEKRASIW